MKKIAKFVFGALLILTALGMFTKSEIFAGIISAFLGIIILPPISENLKEKFKLWNNKGMRYISYLVLVALIGVTTDKGKLPKTNPEVSKTPPKTNAIENSNPSETGNSGVYNANGEKVGTVSNVQKEKPTDDSDFWENYSSKVKTRIHKLIQEEDCTGLQQEFDIAGDNNLAQKRRTGTGNVELMDFIDENMKEMGCYGKR